MSGDAEVMDMKIRASGAFVSAHKRAGKEFPARLAWTSAAASIRHALCDVVFFEDHIHLASISVPREHRGKGHARAAMDALLAVADDFGLPVSLETAYPDDTDMQRGMDPVPWYERLGFEHDGMYGDMIRTPKQQGVQDV